MTVAQIDAVEAACQVAQDRIEPDLVAALRALRAGRGRGAAAMVRAFDAGNLETRERRAIEGGMREILRRGGVTHLCADAPTPHDLHRAGVDGGRPRMIGRAFALLDDEAGRAAPAEI